MKTYLTYGFAMALTGALLNLILYFAGFHSDPAKLKTAQWIGGVAGLSISIVCIVLGTKARRAETPASEEFGYGSALFAGFMITLIAAALGVVTNYLYFHVINPGFNDVIIQTQMTQLETKGLSPTQLEQAEKGLRFFTSVPVQSVFVFIAGLIAGTVISLITSAFLKRNANNAAPLVA